MRPMLVLALAVAALAAAALPFDAARAAPEPEGVTVERLESLERQVKLLQDEVGYLLAREEALTAAALAATPASKAMVTGLEMARREGFEAAAIPAPSRVALLRTLDGLARDMAGAVPTPTAEEARLVKDLAVRRRNLQSEVR
jgi:hypothetical protein